jgi:guanylate kinase
MMMSGQIYIFSGPSGVGKSTIIQAIRKEIKGLGYSISHTSRAPRGRERNGSEYHFVSPEQFEAMIRNKEFAEWAKIYQDFYGTSWSSLRTVLEQDLDVIMDVDSQGARNIKNQYPAGVLVFILPPSLEELAARLRARATDEEPIIQSRISKAQEEIKNCVYYDYLIINDNLEEAVVEAQAVIRAERCRRPVRLPEIKERFGL